MKTETEILNRINGLIVEMKDTKQSMKHGRTDLFFYMEHKRRLLSITIGIEHLCWVIDYEISDCVFELL